MLTGTKEWAVLLTVMSELLCVHVMDLEGCSIPFGEDSCRHDGIRQQALKRRIRLLYKEGECPVAKRWCL